MDYRYDNVITLRTFSKIYGLAGLRVGYGFAHEELIANMLKVKLTFEPSVPAQVAAIAALDDTEFVERSLALNARGLQAVHRPVSAKWDLKWFRRTPISSWSRWRMPNAAKWLTGELVQRGVIVRPLGAFGLPQAFASPPARIRKIKCCSTRLGQLHLEEVLCRK